MPRRIPYGRVRDVSAEGANHPVEGNSSTSVVSTLTKKLFSSWPFGGRSTDTTDRHASPSSSSSPTQRAASPGSPNSIAVVPKHRTFLFLTARCPQYFAVQYLDTSLFGFHHGELVVYGDAAGPSFAGRLAIVVGVRGGALWVLDEGEVVARPLLLTGTEVAAATANHHTATTNVSSPSTATPAASRKRARSLSESSPPSAAVSLEPALVARYGLMHYALLGANASLRRRCEAERLQRALEADVSPLPNWSAEVISFLQHAPDLLATFRRDDDRNPHPRGSTHNKQPEGSTSRERSADETSQVVVTVVLTPNATAAGPGRCNLGWCGERTAMYDPDSGEGDTLHSFSVVVALQS